MTKSRGVIFWDFDGTLVHFTAWRLALMDVLNESEPGHHIDPERIRPYLHGGFPWHKPEEPHIHLSNPDDWWRALEPVFLRAYEGVGYRSERAEELARQVRPHMIKPERFVLYEDTIQVLSDLKQKGWRHTILSNHMPELPDVVSALGLFKHIDYCLTSAATGYEKPNPRAFSNALARAGHPEKVWMVGDNLNSDVQGAETAGIPSILVHSPKVKDVKYHAATLFDVVEIIENNPVPLAAE